MKKRLILSCILVLVLFLSGCVDSRITKNAETVDKSTQIITYTQPSETGDVNYSTYEMEYIQDGKKYSTWWSPRLRPALDYLKKNAEQGDKVLTWWDNGHLIRGYTRLEPLVYTPSYELLDTVAGGEWDEETLGEFAETDLITNVAYALLSDSPKITMGVMRRYGANWAFAARIDEKKIAGMVKLMGEDMGSYLDDIGDIKATVRQKVIFKMADGWTIKGFEMRYEDDYATVYYLPDES
ncbi:hypothetical protein ACFL3V_05410 [Nanoarchaeota archaeon]